MALRIFQNNEEAALRAKEIVDNSFKLDKKNARFVTPVKYDKTSKGYKVVTVTKIPGQRARTHRVTIEIEDGYEGPFNKANVSIDCLAGETKVLTDKGWKTLFSLAEDWEPGDPLTVNYIVNGKTYKGSSPFYKGRKPTWKIELHNGSSICATANHKILVSRKGEHIWVAVKNLRKDDNIVLNNNLDLLDEPSRSRLFKEAYFAGFWYGDGSFAGNQPTMEVPKGRKEKSLARIVDMGFVDDVKENKNGCKRPLFNHKVKEALAKFDFYPETHHTISQTILEDQEKLFGFLSGLLDADGNCYNRGAMCIAGSTELFKIFEALNRFGIFGVRYRLGQAKGIKTNFGERNKDLYYLYFSSETMDILKNHLWLVRYPESFKRDYISSNTSKIAAISYSGRKNVYDIYVPTIHRFVANTMIVHNCDCGRHLFVWNYALNQYGAAIKDRTNGEAPVETNPAEIPGCCIDGEALISTKFGYKKIADLKIGDRVKTLNGLRKVVQQVYMGIRSTLTIVTESGIQLNCTPNHLILVTNDEQGTFWKQAKYIKSDDFLVVEKDKEATENDSGDIPVDEALKRSKNTVLERASTIKHDKIPVYDIGIQGTPHFYANGIYVHNCKHSQIALRLLLRVNPYWKKVSGKKVSGKAIPLTTLSTMKKRILKGRV